MERNLIRELERRQLKADDPEKCNSAQRGAEPEGYTQGETKKTADNAEPNQEETTNVYTAVSCVRPASGGAVEISQDLEIKFSYIGPERRTSGTTADAVATDCRAWGAQLTGRGPRRR